LKPKKPNRIEPNRKNRAKTEKTEPNRKKPSQTDFKPVFVLKNEPKLVGLNRFWFFLYFGLIFFDKNQTKLNKK